MIAHPVTRTWLIATALASLMGSAAAQPAAPPAKPSVDADGTVHLQGFAVPPSSYISKEAQAKLVVLMSHPYPPMPGPTAPLAEFQKGRDILDREIYIPGAERAMAKYPVDTEVKNIGGVYTEIFTPKGGVPAKNQGRVIVNLHGGGFYNGARTAGRLESIPVANLAQTKVVSIDYRQAPEFKFPAASQDVAAVYKELLKEYKAENIGIYGCSAGGALTAQAVAWFQKENLPRPGAIGIFCAGAVRGGSGDATYIAPAFAYAQNPPPPPKPGQAGGAGMYFVGADLNDPLVSPAASPAVLAKFPPTLVITATRDTALSAAIYTHTQLVKAGVEAELHVWEGLWHGFFGDTDLPESRDAYDVIVRFFDRHLGH
jgi:monoterpene epsilon-lactone hydrolase